MLGHERREREQTLSTDNDDGAQTVNPVRISYNKIPPGKILMTGSGYGLDDISPGDVDVEVEVEVDEHGEGVTPGSFLLFFRSFVRSFVRCFFFLNLLLLLLLDERQRGKGWKRIKGKRRLRCRALSFPSAAGGKRY